ncbi:hypothetical protein RND71_040354 [Anisodus tanguticus]|uniref:Uncharacterized protein n=1 Tax=Anisodus tanguticus TaxID=243964 RepID=A0AAE1QVF4_9SOLA|nr:hypothetical protein RND71_040354 [Anisodus tanguticus]
MAPKNDISEIGQEGFTLLDEVYERKKKPSPSYQLQKSQIVQLKSGSNSAIQGRVINSHEAVQLYGGIIFSDYSKRKSTTLAYQ